MKELILAVRLERELTKAEILSIYLNHVYLGHGAYGVGAAAETYFGKEVEDLTIAEAAMLAGLVASPTKYAPHRNMQLARERQRYVLGAHARGQVHLRRRVPGRARRADRARRRERPQSPRLAVLRRAHPPARDRALRQRELFRGGLRFYSTLDTRMQAAAEGALRKGLESLDRRLGFRGPIGAVAPTAARRVDRRPRAPAHRRAPTTPARSPISCCPSSATAR